MNAIRRSRGLSTFVAAAAILALVSGCGNKDSDGKGDGSGSVPKVISSPTAKPKVQEHGALVYGAFSHYVLKPFEAGTLTADNSKGKQAIAQAEGAILVTVRELGLMKQAALSDDKLRPVAVRIDNLLPRLGSVLAQLQNKRAKSVDVNRAASALDNLISSARAAGAVIALDKVPPVKPTS